MSMEIGRVIGTEKRPNTAYTFTFWTPVDTPVGIGTLVKVVTDSVTVYGAVVEAEGFNDLESPLHEFLAVGGDATLIPPTERTEMRVYEAAVLRRVPEEPIGAVPIGRVYLASADDVQIALNTDKYKDAFGVPCGVYGDKKSPVPVYLDHRYLLGPESGHLNVTGTSGLASKTSYILWLLQCIFQSHGELEDRDEKGVAAVLFNTKGGDLMYLDHPHDEGEPIPQEDLDLYEVCKIEPKPFDKVRYFAPYDNNLADLATVRINPELDAENPVRPITFGLEDVLRHMEVLLNRDDLDAKADGYLQYLAHKVHTGQRVEIAGETREIKTLDDLVQFVEGQIAKAETSNNIVEGHNGFTIRKMRNRLGNLQKRFPGIIATDGVPTGPLGHPFEPGSVTVIDVQSLRGEAQDLMFAGVITKLQEMMETGKLGVARLIVMIDEMNKYAPSGGSDTYVLRSLKDISARGRYMGLTLFGAQQFRSRVDKEIVGNAATHVFGHIEAEELAQPGYSYFAPSVKEKLGALPQGSVLVKHPYFAQPVFVRFPRPASLKGSDGMRKYRKTVGRSLKETLLAEVARFKEHAVAARGAITELKDDDEELRGLLVALKRLANEDDPLRVIRREGKKAAPVREVSHLPPMDNPDDFDPFA